MDNFTIWKITAVARTFNADGTQLTEGQVKWNKWCHLYGLLPHHYGKTFTFGADSKYKGQAKMIGIEKKNKKYPIIVKLIGSDTEIKMTAQSAVNYLKNSSLWILIKKNKYIFILIIFWFILWFSIWFFIFLKDSREC